jgi:hypothetical protein
MIQAGTTSVDQNGQWFTISRNFLVFTLCAHLPTSRTLPFSTLCFFDIYEALLFFVVFLHQVKQLIVKERRKKKEGRILSVLD